MLYRGYYEDLWPKVLFIFIDPLQDILNVPYNISVKTHCIYRAYNSIEFTTNISRSASYTISGQYLALLVTQYCLVAGVGIDSMQWFLVS